MVATRADLEKRLSGGASNSDPNLSLGGIMSSSIVRSQAATYPTSTIAGVTLVEGLGHAPNNLSPSGSGSLVYTNSGQTLDWTPINTTGGVLVPVGVDGRYVIPSSDVLQYLLVDVVAASLPVSDTSADVDIDTLSNTLFDDVGDIEAALGMVDYRCFYVINTNSTDDILNVRVYIPKQPEDGDELDIGVDPAGVGDGSTTGVATTIPDEDTAPAGVSFSRPATLGAAVTVGNLMPSEAAAIWVRRTVPPNTFPIGGDDKSRIQFGVSFV